MPIRTRGAAALSLFVVLTWLLPSTPAEAADVWSGLTHSFSKPDGADGSLPEYQDTLTPGVIFARGGIGGLYNAATEPNFLATISPEFTEWATDLLVANAEQPINAMNWANLTFAVFADAYGGAVGFNAVGRDAVVHLINEDIYLDLQITSWTDGHQIPSGGFSYLRAEPPMPEPTGDYNGNHVVDAADYTIWRDTLGSTTDLRANGDDSGASMGVIDQADYNYWKARFGNPAPGGASSQAVVVPEPAAVVLFSGGLFACTFSALMRRRRPL